MECVFTNHYECRMMKLLGTSDYPNASECQACGLIHLAAAIDDLGDSDFPLHVVHQKGQDLD